MTLSEQVALLEHLAEHATTVKYREFVILYNQEHQCFFIWNEAGNMHYSFGHQWIPFTDSRCWGIICQFDSILKAFKHIVSTYYTP